MKKYKIYGALGMLSLLTILSCKKKEANYEALTDSKNGASVYITKSGGNSINLGLFPAVDEMRTVNFAASFGAVGLPKSEIPVQFATDDKAFDSLNVIRVARGLAPYLKFPTDGYTISSLSATIPSGALNSNNITVSYNATKFDLKKDYLLPISITNANGYQIGSNKSIFIIAPKVEEIKATTTGWVATASSEQPSGENTGKASALIDGDLSTIWHAQYSGGTAGSYPYLIQYDMINPIYATRISIAPRQNNGTGPTSFKVEGSLDGTTYTTILNNQIFNPDKRDGTYQDYPFPGPTQIRYLRVTLLQGKQTLSFLSEIAVYKY